jgi:hypothetical protein
MYIKKSKQDITALYLKETQKNSFLGRADVIPRVLDLPVCPKCERPMLKDKGWTAQGIARCVTRGCGWSGPVEKTYSVELHLLDGGG